MFSPSDQDMIGSVTETNKMLGVISSLPLLAGIDLIYISYTKMLNMKITT